MGEKSKKYWVAACDNGNLKTTMATMIEALNEHEAGKLAKIEFGKDVTILSIKEL